MCIRDSFTKSAHLLQAKRTIAQKQQNDPCLLPRAHRSKEGHCPSATTPSNRWGAVRKPVQHPRQLPPETQFELAHEHAMPAQGHKAAHH
eukprot:2236269-Prorocentrum_lima.AAC.1